MTAPDPFGINSNPIRRANWLGRYMEVQKGFEQELAKVLTEAERGVTAYIDSLGVDTFSGALRSAQLSLAKTAIRGMINDLFTSGVKGLIQGFQSTAASAAVDAALYDQRGILARIFSNPTERQNYANSLRQTAERNVESTITRVLFTAQPLSHSVYKTKALANGYIDRAINNGLARGDSAADIALAVSKFINPKVPGGVSYAAKRLGRTEIHNAFHAQSVADAQDIPWIDQMLWNLSKQHNRDPGDLCESYALIRYFPVENVPMPPHPNCYCFVTSVIPDYDLFEQGLLSGQYDTYLDDVLGQAA